MSHIESFIYLFRKVDRRDFHPNGRSSAMSLPMSAHLKRSGQRPQRKGHEPWMDEKEKDTKVSKIFQVAITALSFLAFGGYLLTLIITSIKRNGANKGAGNVIVFSVQTIDSVSCQLQSVDRSKLITIRQRNH